MIEPLSPLEHSMKPDSRPPADEEYVLPSTEALLAGTLALMLAALVVWQTRSIC